MCIFFLTFCKSLSYLLLLDPFFLLVFCVLHPTVDLLVLLFQSPLLVSIWFFPGPFFLIEVFLIQMMILISCIGRRSSPRMYILPLLAIIIPLRVIPKIISWPILSHPFLLRLIFILLWLIFMETIISTGSSIHVIYFMWWSSITELIILKLGWILLRCRDLLVWWIIIVTFIYIVKIFLVALLEGGWFLRVKIYVFALRILLWMLRVSSIISRWHLVFIINIPLIPHPPFWGRVTLTIIVVWIIGLITLKISIHYFTVEHNF